MNKFLKFIKAGALALALGMVVTTVTPMQSIAAPEDYTPRRRKKFKPGCPINPLKSLPENTGATDVGGAWQDPKTPQGKTAQQIFDFLTLNMGYSGAAAAGIMSNIYYESGFIEDAAEVYDSSNPSQKPYPQGVPAQYSGGVYRFGRYNKEPIKGMAFYPNHTNPDGTLGMLGGGGLVQFTPYTKFSDSEWFDKKLFNEHNILEQNGWGLRGQMVYLWKSEFEYGNVLPYMNGEFRNAGARAYGIEPPFQTLQEFYETSDPAKASDAFQVGYERPGEYNPKRKEMAIAMNKHFNPNNRPARRNGFHMWRDEKGRDDNGRPISLKHLFSKEDYEICFEKDDFLEYSIWPPTENWEESIVGNMGETVTINSRYNLTAKLNGVLLKGKMGQEVFSPLPGKIVLYGDVKEGYYGHGGGKLLVIEHENGWKSIFTNVRLDNEMLSKYLLNQADDIKMGQKVAHIDGYFSANYPSIVWELYHNGKPVDPIDALKNSQKYKLPVPSIESMAQIPSGDAFKQLMSMEGGTYVLGAANPATRTFDCSGLTKWFIKLWKGIDLYHGSIRQSREYGREVNSGSVRPELYQPGDLLFFNTDGSGVASHVGIYIGGGQMIHAASEEYGIMRSNITNDYWTSRFISARR